MLDQIGMSGCCVDLVVSKDACMKQWRLIVVVNSGAI